MRQDFGDMNRQVIEKFRETGGVGEIGPVHFDRLVLLTTNGRRSGKQHTVAIGKAPDADGNMLLFASNRGAPQDPDWYRNLAVDPNVTVEITGQTFDTQAEILTGAERADAYNRWIEMAPHVAGDQEKAGRIIPMVRIRNP